MIKDGCHLSCSMHAVAVADALLILVGGRTCLCAQVSGGKYHAYKFLLTEGRGIVGSRAEQLIGHQYWRFLS